MAAAAIMDFQNLKFLTLATVKSVELHTLLNFVEIARTAAEISRFFKMAAAAILNFKNFKFLMVGTFKRVELHHFAKFRRNRSNRCRDMRV